MKIQQHYCYFSIRKGFPSCVDMLGRYSLITSLASSFTVFEFLGIMWSSASSIVLVSWYLSPRLNLDEEIRPFSLAVLEYMLMGKDERGVSKFVEQDVFGRQLVEVLKDDST